MNRKVPYIGVTGFMSRQEVEAVLKAVPTDTKRKLMVGVLASSNTIQGITNNKPNRYPAADKIAGIFTDSPRALNLVHFNTKDPNQLFTQMMDVTELAGKNFHGFQLNIKWPNPYTIEAYKVEHPDKVVVLQCGEAALDSVSNDPIVMASVAVNYQGFVDYLLVDPSGGLGRALNPSIALEYLKQLHARVKDMGFGVAGGCSPTTVEDLIQPVAEVYPNTSIDAEGKIRDENDHLDISKTLNFVSKSFKIFSQYEK